MAERHASIASLEKINGTELMTVLKQFCICMTVGCLYLNPLKVFAQATTYSPYTKEQLQQFNSQPISPAISVNEIDGQTPGPQNFRGSKLYQQSPGEEEAEVLETQSVDPYTPVKPALTF